MGDTKTVMTPDHQRLFEIASEQIVAGWLAVGRDVAVLSHESALEWLGLSDVVSATIHFTIPRSQRSRAPVPEVTLHTTSQPLTAVEVTVLNGIRMTTAARSILDAAATTSVAGTIVTMFQPMRDRMPGVRSQAAP